MSPRRLLAGAAVLVVMLAWAGGPARAQGPYYAGWGWGCTLYPPYTGYCPPHVPYFAFYPPVYYSEIVPRTYGQSPFAYPAVGLAPAGTGAVDSPAPTPRLIINPYVAQPQEVAKPPAPNAEILRPAVVYPAAVAARQ